MTDLKQVAAKALSLMDLTTLNDDDTNDIVINLCKQAKTSVGSTAAVCVYPRFVPIARKTLKALGADSVKIATVTNFPHGDSDIEIAVAETKAAVAYGADEVDVVFPYKALMSGNAQIGYDLVRVCKDVCGDAVLLKVIIESGELESSVLIRLASEIAIEAGADFIKTSTGKVPVNATLEAAKIMLQVIKDKNPSVGFKAAGGVKTAQQAADYLALAESIMGADWVSSKTFRFGASSLLGDLLATLGVQTNQSTTGY